MFVKNKKNSDLPEGMLYSWKGSVNHLLERYATDSVITETEMEILNVKSSSAITPKEYREAPWTNVLRCNHVYTE